MNNIVFSKGLTEEIRAQIKALDSVCSNSEPLCMKLNWDMLDSRSDSETNDLLYYQDGILVGFLGLYGFGSKPEEIEITGMVHPHYRRNRIFTKLFNEAITLCRSRGADRLLLIAERLTASGQAFSKNAGLTYSFSEYRMICNVYQPQSQNVEGFKLRPADDSDIPFLTKLDEICFGSTFPGGYKRELDNLFIAEHAGGDIGKIGLIYENGMGYVFGVAILPESRGLGYGRAMLDAVIKKHFDQYSTPVILEVAVKNEGALTLYKSCGFSELTIYDYYEFKL